MLVSALGAGCWLSGDRTDFVEAPPLPPVEVLPNKEGALASTGGMEATVTPIIATELLVKTLPGTLNGFSAQEPLEIRHPVPLPDGTRSEYVSVEREYLFSDGGRGNVLVTISDTRGLPVLTAFMKSIQTFDDGSTHRTQTDIQGVPAWVTFTEDASQQGRGAGSVNMLYRGRFLIQVDASGNLTERQLKDFVASFDLAPLQ